MSGTLLGFVALLLVAGSMAFWFQRMRAVRIPADRRGFVVLWLVAAIVGLYALTLKPGWIGGVSAGLAAFAGMFLSLLVGISPQKVSDDAIRVGESLRNFTGIDENGNEFALETTAGKPLLLKFFRGHW